MFCSWLSLENCELSYQKQEHLESGPHVAALAATTVSPRYLFGAQPIPRIVLSPAIYANVMVAG